MFHPNLRVGGGAGELAPLPQGVEPCTCDLVTGRLGDARLVGKDFRSALPAKEKEAQPRGFGALG